MAAIDRDALLERGRRLLADFRNKKYTASSMFGFSFVFDVPVLCVAEHSVSADGYTDHDVCSFVFFAFVLLSLCFSDFF